MIWFLQGQSSQREVIAGAIEVVNGRVPVIASHRHHRPEITAAANIVLREPADDALRVDWAYDMAMLHGVKVMLVGRAGHEFEFQRDRFESVGIDLVTGGMSVETHHHVDDKSLFTAAAVSAGLTVIPAITVKSADELVAALAYMKKDVPVCVKPARGIYGMGFWRVEEDADPFRCFGNADGHIVNESIFVQAYRSSAKPKPLLVMPYMSGSECSVDMVVHKGKVISHCARRKEGSFQTLSLTDRAVDLSIHAAEFFRCDGIVNVQSRDDADGVPHLLEINPRYSGGIGYTRFAGINLPGIFAASRLGLSMPKNEWVEGVRIKGIASAVRVDLLANCESII